MKKPPAGDFSDILAGLAGEDGLPDPGPTRRATSSFGAVLGPGKKVDPDARRAKAPMAAKRTQAKKNDEKLASPDIASPDIGCENEAIKSRPAEIPLLSTLKKLAAALFWPAANLTSGPRSPKRPRLRLPRLSGVISWASQKGGVFPKNIFRKNEPAESAPIKGAAAARERRAAPSRPPRTEDEAIAAEMGLHADLASADLKRIRREFAKKNHPDRIEAPQRVSATRRMSIANMLIDQHLKKKPVAK
ncbi:hypothetical protein SAMN05444581_108179 [Methylocapsa palsarum]|uniref:DnaJ domain-containing protein n=2 Tax=Methylocapsa palsarum TaxID=1612308 RepID=A0A1I3ZVG9_9HYPH|nr:hypothetical protein SAMN05444581_108179 [Methylocapsa palsarum]